MDFALSEEHKIFQRTVTQFAQKEIAPLGKECEEKEEYPKGLFRRAGELGFLGIPYPEEYGGTGPDTIALSIFAEEVTKADAGIAMGLVVQNTVGTSPIYNFGSEELRGIWYPLSEVNWSVPLPSRNPTLVLTSLP